MDQIDQAAVDTIAAVLRSRAGDGGEAAFGERTDLEPAAVEGLREVFGDRVEKSRRVSIPRWESVGQVDIVVHSPETPDEPSVLAELKWCRAQHDVVFEGVWDCFKMALATLRPESPRAYLITGAHASVWAKSPFADLFETATHDPVELCMRDIGGRDHWLAWDALLYGGSDRYPDAVPAALRTTVVGRSPVGDSELRAVEVRVASADWIPWLDGWPHGLRPAQAHRPELAPPSRFVDTDDDIQWVQATLPENRELVEYFKSIGLWPDADDE